MVQTSSPLQQEQANFRAGVNAGNSITSGGNYNTVVGDGAGTAITTGNHNTAFGLNALASEDTGSGNTAIGRAALENFEL
jgi:trimeric autotransporter adhesin